MDFDSIDGCTGMFSITPESSKVQKSKYIEKKARHNHQNLLSTKVSYFNPHWHLYFQKQHFVE